MSEDNNNFNSEEEPNSSSPLTFEEQVSLVEGQQDRIIHEILRTKNEKYVPLLHMTTEMVQEANAMNAAYLAQKERKENVEEENNNDDEELREVFSDMQAIGGLILSLFMEFRVVCQAYENLEREYLALKEEST